MKDLGRLKRERDRIEQHPDSANKKELLKSLDSLIKRLENREEALLSALEDEWKAEQKRGKSAAQRAILAAFIIAFAATLGYSVNVPIDATEDELLRVISLLHGLAVIQSMQQLGYAPPLTLAVDQLPPWVIPLPEAPSISAWRDAQPRQIRFGS